MPINQAGKLCASARGLMGGVLVCITASSRQPQWLDRPLNMVLPLLHYFVYMAKLLLLLFHTAMLSSRNKGKKGKKTDPKPSVWDISYRNKARHLGLIKRIYKISFPLALHLCNDVPERTKSRSLYRGGTVKAHFYSAQGKGELATAIVEGEGGHQRDKHHEN